MNFAPDLEEAKYRDLFREIAEDYDWAKMREIRDEIEANDAERYSIPFLKMLGEHGLIGLSWPQPHGKEATAAQRMLFAEELECQGFPGYGLTQTERQGSMLTRVGTPEQIERFLPNTVNASWRYCSGLSEPGAGSDLLSLRTSARRDGDHYIVNGSKLWTSGAHLAHWVSAIVRTDPEATRHRGLSVLLIEMSSPGIVVQPVRVMGGWRVNAVFFDDVRVPVENLVGAENKGWEVLTGNLNDERAMSFGGTETRLFLNRMLHRYSGRADELDDAQLEELGRLVTDCEADRLMYLRVALQAGRNDDNSGTGPMSKVFGSELAQRFVRWASDLLGQDAMYPESENSDQLAADIEEQVRVSTVLSIIGGTSEVQRNTAAQRSLNLPRGS